MEKEQMTGQQNAADTFYFPLRATSLKELRVACVTDVLTQESLRPECVLLELTPDKWQEEIEAFQPDLLFIESAWHGKENLWTRKVDRDIKELTELTSYARSRRIPIVFWNKEDPDRNAIFMTAASYADVIFTTDVDCIPFYLAECGHKRVYHMHFAAQPLLHNPVEKYTRQDKFCFAGAYYHNRPKRCQNFDDFTRLFAAGKGLDIYDKNLFGALPQYTFPSWYEPYILGSLAPRRIDVAYKGYDYGVNMNSVTQSQSMFARRVFELMASNTVVVGNYARGLKNYFGDLTICTDDVTTLSNCLDRYCGNPETMRKYRLLGLRKVLSEDMWEDRLDYIVQKVFGRSLKPAPPPVTVLAFVKNIPEAKRAERMFLSQTFANKRLILIGAATGAQKRSYRFISQEKARKITLESVCKSGYAALFDARDWYGPMYLTDLMLSLRYGEWTAIGKTARYMGENGKPVLHDAECAYKPTKALNFRSAVCRVDVLSGKTLAELAENSPLYADALSGVGGSDAKLLGVDEFNYCGNWNGNTCPEASDLPVADQGLPLSFIEQRAEAAKADAGNQANSLTIPGSAFAKLPISPRSLVTFTVTEDGVVIESRLPKDKHAYFMLDDVAIDPKLYAVGGKLTVHSMGRRDENSTASCVLIPLDASGKKLDPIFFGIGNIKQAEILPQAVSAQIGIRIAGTGKITLKEIVLGRPDRFQQSCFFSRSNVLVLTNQYPSPENLYRNMFVHARLRKYWEEGRVFDVMRMYPGSQEQYREFDGINVLEGTEPMLFSILNHSQIHTVCIHFLYSFMWNVLLPYVQARLIRLLIWVHGVEIQPWWRRDYNYPNKEDLEKAKPIFNERMKMWREVFRAAECNENIHFIFVSQYFADEVMEDYKVRLRPEQYSIIHNLIDTEKFTYVKKDPEQRKKILTIKTFANAKYANDLTTRGILELSKRSCFQDMEFDIYGEGQLFDQENVPLKQFENVHLHRGFLTHDEIAALHKEHGIFIGTTRMDAQGVSRDEAMSSGLVPIANNCTAIPEFVDENCGILIPPESYVELADALERLYHDPKLFERLSENAAKRVRGQSSSAFTIARELKLIDAAVAAAEAETDRQARLQVFKIKLAKEQAGAQKTVEISAAQKAGQTPAAQKAGQTPSAQRAGQTPSAQRADKTPSTQKTEKVPAASQKPKVPAASPRPFAVNAEISNGELLCRIVLAKADPSALYACYLCDQNKKILERRLYGSENAFRFQLPAYGAYYVKGYIKTSKAEDGKSTVQALYSNLIPYTPPKPEKTEKLRLGRGIALSSGTPSELDAIVEMTEITAGNETLSVKLHVRAKTDAQFAFYLLRGRDIIVRGPYQTQTGYAFRNLSPGSYRIKYYVRLGTQTRSYFIREIRL